MPNVETVRGPVGTADLGQVLMHEHVFILSHEFIVNYPDIEGFDADRDIAAAVVRMNDLVDAGVSTIVDLTVAGLGRDVALVQRVAEQTSLNIVVATGYYTFTELPTSSRCGPGSAAVSSPTCSPGGSSATSPRASPTPA